MKLDYETWMEVYSIEWIRKGEVLLEECIKVIQEWLSFRKPEKYWEFLKQLEKTELVLKIMNVPEYKKRVQLLRYMYYGLRLLDDICDGDTITDFSLEDRKRIIEWKYWIGLYDLLMSEVQKIAHELWLSQEIQYSINEIVWSMRFDVDRIIDSHKERKRNDLEKNFHKMDIIWTVYGTAIIFWLIPESTINQLEGLWIATRISFNINDLQEDVVEWLINISIEEMHEYWISKNDLEKLKEWEITEHVWLWIQSEISKIQDILSEYNKNYSFMSIVWWNWIELFYSTKYFRKVFNNLLLKYLVLPKWYIQEINNVVKKFSNSTS